MKTDLFSLIGKVLLTIFLFATHAKLFYWLDPVFENDELIKFSWVTFNEKTIQAEIIGALFATITIFVLERRKNSPMFRIFAITVAILDGVALMWLYNETIIDFWRLGFATTHYVIYTVFIIITYAFAGKESHINNDSTQINNCKKVDKAQFTEREIVIIGMLEEGIKGAEIARELKIDPAIISRLKKRYQFLNQE